MHVKLLKLPASAKMKTARGDISKTFEEVRPRKNKTPMSCGLVLLNLEKKKNLPRPKKNNCANQTCTTPKTTNTANSRKETTWLQSTFKMNSIPPTHQPIQPSKHPSIQPSIQPSNHPTIHPTIQPSNHPAIHPTIQPSNHPTNQPTTLQKPTPFQPNTQPKPRCCVLRSTCLAAAMRYCSNRLATLLEALGQLESC